jgi:DNA-binding transcriptional regulator YiaG
MTANMKALYEHPVCPSCGGLGSIKRVSGAYIREVREAANWSLRQMAKKLGISPAYLSDMELGRRGMSEEIAQRIIHFCENGGSR